MRFAFSSNTKCLVTACRVISRCSHNSLNVCPFSSRNSSSNFLRLGSARALKTASISHSLCNHSVACQARHFSYICVMSFLDLEQLPFVGMSYELLGEKQGAPFSAYIVNAKPGQGP